MENNIEQLSEIKKLANYNTPFTQTIAASLASSVVLLIFSYYAPPFIRNLTAGGFYGTGLSEVAPALLTIAFLMTSLLIITYPIIWAWNAYNWKQAMLVVVFQIIWLIILAMAVNYFAYYSQSKSDYINHYPTDCVNCSTLH